MARFWCGSALALLVISGESIAQPSLGASAGVAVPDGALGARRTAAPYVRHALDVDSRP